MPGSSPLLSARLALLVHKAAKLHASPAQANSGWRLAPESLVLCGLWDGCVMSLAVWQLGV